ncbi:MAG: isopentenyl-diphosphate Delta-isomerase [Gemmatimonadales bacterium]
MTDLGRQTGNASRNQLQARARIEWLAPARTTLSGLPLWGRMPVITYDKLTIAELLPEHLCKAIWLDCDMLVLADLAELWLVPMDGSQLLAVPDTLVPTVASRFGINAFADVGLEGSSPYFNAGMMVFDPQEWRNSHVASFAVEYLKERESLESLARDLGITANVEFLGWLEPEMIERELSSAWALAAPSLWPEPLGLVALEAVARRVPVLASAVGGFSESLEEGVTGILVPNGDVIALADGLRALIGGRAFPDGVSEDAARPVIERHDIGRHIKRMESIFEDVVDSKQYVVLVDKNDQTLGAEEKLLAHEKGLRHRAVSVFILDRSNRLLMQRRALSKYHSPGLWSNTCCGHPEVGESPLDAAKRRLAQEMNITCDLERLGGFMYRADVGDDLIEHEYDHVFLGYYDRDPEVASEEVESFAWVTLVDLTSDMKTKPDRYTKWFPEALSYLTSQGYWVATV